MDFDVNKISPVNNMHITTHANNKEKKRDDSDEDNTLDSSVEETFHLTFPERDFSNSTVHKQSITEAKTSKKRPFNNLENDEFYNSEKSVDNSSITKAKTSNKQPFINLKKTDNKVKKFYQILPQSEREKLRLEIGRIRRDPRYGDDPVLQLMEADFELALSNSFSQHLEKKHDNLQDSFTTLQKLHQSSLEEKRTLMGENKILEAKNTTLRDINKRVCSERDNLQKKFSELEQRHQELLLKIPNPENISVNQNQEIDQNQETETRKLFNKRFKKR